MTKFTALSLFLVCKSIFADYLLHTLQQATEIQVKSWKELRDEGVEKQDLDYSCGSSAVATILRSYYGIEVYEKDILKEVERLGNEESASFSDLQDAVKLFGFTATGIATDIDTLKTIKIPALLYLKYRNQDHFSVLRGISDSHVLLADPSWGNRTFTIHKFSRSWLNNDSKGKVLIITPNIEVKRNVKFFFPPEVSNLPVKLLKLH